ncbi:MAG: tetratricopeptide repeat protein [Bacteroidales bacterium]|nr:tetratricopeptide repeat protein [Bacteroidales bacterium]
MKSLIKISIWIIICVIWISCNSMSAEDYLYEGRKSASMQDSEKALEYFNKAVDKNPTLTAAYIERGKTFFNIREYEKSMIDFSKAIELSPEDPEAYYGRGLVYQFRNDMPNACKDWENAAYYNHPQSKEILRMCQSYL